MKKKGILGKIIIIIVVIAVLGAIFGGKDKGPAPSGSTNTANTISKTEPPRTENTQNSSGRIGGNESTAKANNTTNPGDSQGAKQPEKQDTKQPENTAQNSADPAKDPNYISPDLKAFLQSYEAFMDEYCEFMENYNSSDISQLAKYASLMQNYNDFAKKADAYDESTMTDAESIYYAETLNRISIKLLKASQKVK